ncbi:MAG: hypothetical protein A2096_03735 [Spirochaetes bacterium GWF1_41_5]|nr:MAG: hypothetical protein A2096_03735 [Spirochaetes bacterium GWF1_41_5]HBE02795.1 hypothetical protein [Spirochaetia bacterium]
MKHKILFVDDEKNILSAVKRSFRDSGYEVLFAESGKEALARLTENQVSVIITDMRMPEMDGAEFLEKAEKIQPDAVRMALSGYSDRDTILRAVNSGHIWRYIAKPWEDSDLLMAINNALQLYENVCEKKRLTHELAVINASLELEVQRRTRELNSRTEVLNMMLEDADTRKVLEKACSLLSESLSGHCGVYTISGSEWIIPQDQSLSSAGREAAQKTGETKLEAGRIMMPLIKGGNLLGVFLAEEKSGKQADADSGGFQKMIGEITRFASIITLALSHQKSLADAPDLLKKIDNIIGGSLG